MSGFEVIGVVLGALPLAVSALEHYRDACKTITLLANFESEWRKALNDIKDEHLLFTLTLKALLLPLVSTDDLDEVDVETLVAEPDNAKWTQDDLDIALRERLGSVHARFIEIAEELQRLLTELLTVIGVDKPRLQARLRASENTTSNNSQESKNRLMSSALKDVLKTTFEYRKEQLKFGFGRSQREDLLSEIRINNKKLERLLEKNDKVASYQKSKTVAVSPKAVKSLLQYWTHANKVHSLICRSLSCPCQEEHCAYLWLEHRTTSTFEFKLLVLWSPQCLAGQPFPPWQSQGLRITCMEGSIARPQNAVPAIAPQKLLHNVAVGALSGGAAPITRECRPLKKAVRFSEPYIPPPAVKRAEQTSTAKRMKTTTETAPAKFAAPREISDLCSAMGACDMQTSCIGALTDNDRGGQYSVYSQPEQKITAGAVTLRAVLLDTARWRLRRSDRFRIALAVSSSHLQLHSTPWAGKQWEAQDIRFPCTGRDGADLLYDQPYVEADFSTKTSERQTARKADRSFACLGIMLLELLFGLNLEEHPLWSSQGFGDHKDKPMVRMMVAREWADNVEGEAGPDFAAAVMWCLNESPNTLEDDQWRRELADKVVLRLQNCCDWIRSKPIT